jgi:DNA-binding FadR family transcriptional regulator
MAIEPVRLGKETSLGPLRTPQLYERIVERILADVRSGALEPGSRLPSERELARRLQVGRSSVREAIGALQVRGVVETRPGAGSFLGADAALRAADAVPERADADASPSALLDARALFEPRVARVAAERARPDATTEALLDAMERAADPDDPGARAGWSDADRHFHRQIAVMTANPVLVSMASHIAELMDQPLWQRLRDESLTVPGRAKIHLAEHRMIYESIVAGDAGATEFYATQHIQRVRRYMTLD